MAGISYRYRAHGFTLDSELELPELAPCDGTADVVIRYGQVPAQLDGEVTRGRRYQATDGHYLLDLPRIARYWVRHGREVVVAPAPDAAADDVRRFVLSSVMAALAHQNGGLALHASAVEIDGHAVLFAGKSGMGKSTLAAAFHDRGYRVVSDDMSVVSFDAAGGPLMHHGYRHLKLHADSLACAGAGLGPRRAIGGKYSVAVPGAASMAPLRIARLFVLARRSAEAVELSALSGPSRLAAVVGETYRSPMAVALGQRAGHFARCAAFCHRVPVVLVHRPFALERLSSLVRCLEDDLRAAAPPLHA